MHRKEIRKKHIQLFDSTSLLVVEMEKEDIPICTIYFYNIMTLLQERRRVFLVWLENRFKGSMDDKTRTQMFTATLFIIAKMWKRLKYPLTDECSKQSMLYIYKMERKNKMEA